MCINLRKAKAEEVEPKIPYKHCLNCNTELKGVYCHVCGQQATNPKPSIRDIIMEYLDNAYMWNPLIIRTLWLLVSRPGFLTKEFLSGRLKPYIHPLRLNMTIMFIFLTIFIFFTGIDKVSNSMRNITHNEMVLPGLQMELLLSNQEYAERIKSSKRDTVVLHTPLFLADSYPDIISKLEVIEDTQGKYLDKWRAIIPHALLEEDIITPDPNGYYKFNADAKIKRDDLDIFYTVWQKMVEITTTYFPLIVLLTAPFLAFSLHLIQRKKMATRMSHFIFALHYTAFLELLITFIYILYLVVSPPMWPLQWIMIIGSCLYLTIAFRRVYENGSWLGTISKSVLTGLIYLIICLLTFLGIFLLSCIIVAETI